MRENMAKKQIEIQDLYRFKMVLDPQISPDGNRVLFVVERMDKKDRTYYSNLYITGIDGRGLKQLTFGKRNDHSPRWSPDSKKLLFIRKNETKSQIWTLSLGGGEAKVLTRMKRGSITKPAFSPDGKQIVFLYHPLSDDVKVDKKGKPKIPVSRHIKDLWFRLDGEGFFDREFTHVWIANAGTGTARQLVNGEYNDAYPCWHPDGKEIAFISFREKDWQHRLEEQDIYTVSVGGGRLSKINAPVGPKEGLSYSPDGKKLAYLGHQRPYHSWGVINYLLNTVHKNGKNHRTYGRKIDRTAVPLTLGDLTPSFVMTSPQWSPDGKEIYFHVSEDGRQSIYAAGTKTTNDLQKITGSDAVAVTSTLSIDGSKLVYHGAALNHLDELYVIGIETSQTRQITHLNRNYIRTRYFNATEEIDFFNGRQKLMGWITKPPNFRRGRKYPLILNIHGGPRCQYGRTFFHEMHVLAAQGYVVLYTNPRGSQGYGERFADTITGKWGEPAMSDLMKAVDHVILQGYVDPDRVGITGGSYGGYMTNWIVTHTNRFRAAVTQRCVSDLASMFGNSDIGWDMVNEFGGTPWEKREIYQKWSPITYIKNCKTPLLIIHSENDLRCNIEQADQMYTSLKYLKREVEFVRFPEEFHGLSRHGRPDRREERLKHIIRWFDLHLK
jgi:dipeptidyl aminopeptidase/acylaminoacyl peptidase